MWENSLKNLTYGKVCVNIYLAIAKQVFQKEIKKKGLGMSLKTFFPVFLFAICSDILLCNKLV